MNAIAKSSPEHRMHGFTLLELLVAVMILGLIMTAAYGAVRLGGRSLEAGIGRTDSTGEIRAVSAFLRRQFAQIVPYAYGDDASFAFSGDAESVAFVAPGPMQSNAAGLLEYSLTAVEDAGGLQLVLTYQPFDVDADVFTGTGVNSSRVLAGRLDGLVFEYFGYASAGARPSWQDDWADDAERLPQLVRVRLKVTDGRAWPVMIFGIRALGDES